MGDPTKTQLDAMTTVNLVAQHVGIEGAIADKRSLLGSLFAHLGLRDENIPAIVGMIPEADYNTTLSTWTVATTVATDGSVTADRPPSMAETGKARFFGRICRLKLMPETPPVVPSSLTSSVTARKVKLSHVISQVDDTEVDLVPEGEVIAMFGRYEAFFGKGHRPPSNREPTVEQLTAMKALLSTGQVPYADFAVWGPHGSRIKKKLKFQGLTFNRQGEMTQTELFGPPSLAAWKVCYEVFLNTMVMLDSVDLSPLLLYQSRIERLHERYSERTWALLYQADVRARLEEWPRIRLELKRAHQVATAAGGATTYDDTRPWNEALRLLSERDRFWTDEFIEPAVMIMADRNLGKAMLAGDAPTGQTIHDSHPSQPAASTPMAAERTPRARIPSRSGRFHDLVEGQYRSNRTGYRLCRSFQEDKCEPTVGGSWCPRASNEVHQCARCLGPHPMCKCPHPEPPQVAFVNKRSQKGGKAGKGGGKAKKGSAPY